MPRILPAVALRVAWKVGNVHRLTAEGDPSKADPVSKLLQEPRLVIAIGSFRVIAMRGLGTAQPAGKSTDIKLTSTWIARGCPSNSRPVTRSTANTFCVAY